MLGGNILGCMRSERTFLASPWQHYNSVHEYNKMLHAFLWTDSNEKAGMLCHALFSPVLCISNVVSQADRAWNIGRALDFAVPNWIGTTVVLATAKLNPNLGETSLNIKCNCTVLTNVGHCVPGKPGGAVSI